MNWQSSARAGRGEADASSETTPADPDSGARAASGDELLGIAEVQLRTGLSPRTLRYYEELDLLPGVRRRAGGRRVYGPEQVERLRFIQRLKKLGLSLAEIKELNAVYAIAGSTRQMLSRLDEVLAHHAEHVTQRIEELWALRQEIERYRTRVGQRIAASGSEPSDATEET